MKDEWLIWVAAAPGLLALAFALVLAVHDVRAWIRSRR